MSHSGTRYALSPLSFVHSSCFRISSCVTVGLTVLKLFKKSFSFSGGSSSSSLSMSDQL